MPLAIVITFVLQEVVVRASLATGKLPARLIAEDGPGRPRTSRAIALVAVGAVVLGAAAFQAGNLTGSSLGLEAMFDGGRAFWVTLCADAAFLLLWFGRYRALEAVLAGLVGLMSICFVATVAMAGIDAGALARGLAPSLADVGLALALVGTTVVPYNLFLHASAVRAKGMHDGSSLRDIRLDLGLALAIGGIITASVLVAAAEALPGADVEGPGDMARSLEPALGPLAQAAFAVGLLAAGFSSALTAPLAAGLAVAQLRDAGRAAAPPRIVWIPVMAVGTFVALLPTEPLPLILGAQVANAFVLPLLVFAFMVVGNSAALGRSRTRWLGNVLLAASLLVTILLVARLVL